MVSTSVAKTQRDDFSVATVVERLESADEDELRRMLGEAIHVISGLRATVEVMASSSAAALEASKNLWMKQS